VTPLQTLSPYEHGAGSSPKPKARMIGMMDVRTDMCI